MDSRAALFDCDSYGRLNIFFVQQCHFPDPTPNGTIPQKTGTAYWNRLYPQKPDGTLKTSRKRAACRVSVMA